MCPNCQAPASFVVKSGFYKRLCGAAARVQRYRCKQCQKRFSTQTTHLTYREHKPHMTLPLMRLLVAGVSQRQCAVVLGIHPVTVARKLCRLGLAAASRLQNDAKKGRLGESAVFDEVETFEHTKCKPVSIALAVEKGSRLIIAAEVASMPAKGKLAALSRRRYGRRKDERYAALGRMLAQIRLACPRLRLLESDQSPRYPELVQKAFPEAEHKTYRGRRGCVVGQGELKAGGWDPLFSLNHTAAMLRDRIKRLSRRTWCTTKRRDRLQMLLHLYAWCHNERIRGAGRLLAL